MVIADRFRTQAYPRRLGVSRLLLAPPVALHPRPGRLQVLLLPQVSPPSRVSQVPQGKAQSPRPQVVPRDLPRAAPPVLLLRLPLRRPPLPRLRSVTPCVVTFLCRLLGLGLRSRLPLRS